MGRTLSQDLRDRVVSAIEGGMSCRQAAVRFGVSAASAIRWRQLAVRNGTAAAKPQGGDQRSGRIEAEADYLLALLEVVDDITLHEMQRRLAEERGLRVGIGTLWRFFDRRGITWKKRPRMPASRTGRTS